jgi:Fur family ferric uptake transcriptional regulator
MERREKLRATLSRHGYKVTSVRQRVYEELAKASQPLSNAQLIRSLHDLDKVSIYRTIALFELIGIVHRIWNGFKSSIELSDAFSPHHHHFTCTNCGKVVSFKSEEIEKALHALETDLHVTISQHLVELNGICDDCQKDQG